MDTSLVNFQQKKDIDFFVKRQNQAEAVSKAVYLITDLMSLDEPLRKALRTISLKLLDADSNKAEILHTIQSHVRISKDMNLISRMNGDLLISAIDKIMNQYHSSNNNIESVYEKVSDTLNKAVHTDYIENQESEKNQEAPLSIDGVKKTSDTHIQVEHTANHANSAIKHSFKPLQAPIVHKNMGDKAPEVISGKTQPEYANTTILDIGSRRKRILEVVRSKGQVTINEFIESIKGCSSKTIQRELTSLVLSGTLKKTGERRWSKYSLK